ncbi:hypothetical protein GEV33_007992 [Tenebrio molitor]|uniref:Uncharacterized protein n=1 Tax=Tenebrio molitor TaxID=7067 RepID=A0A8J6HHL4_TENMO|nr:hypothetical protein GEV33_007992 [Tenebrio molitor]
MIRPRSRAPLGPEALGFHFADLALSTTQEDKENTRYYFIAAARNADYKSRINEEFSKPTTSMCNQEDKANPGYEIFHNSNVAASLIILFHCSGHEGRLQEPFWKFDVTGKNSGTTELRNGQHRMGHCGKCPKSFVSKENHYHRFTGNVEYSTRIAKRRKHLPINSSDTVVRTTHTHDLYFVEQENRRVRRNIQIKNGPPRQRSKQELPDQATMDVVGIVNEMLQFFTEAEIAEVIHIPKADRGLQFPLSSDQLSSLFGEITDKVGFEETPEVFRGMQPITISFNKKKHTGAHQGLLHKLIEAGFPIGLVKIVRSYLPNRTFRTKIAEARSSERGNVSTLEQDAASTTAPYADDTAISVRDSSPEFVTLKLQHVVDTLEKWFKLWSIDVNVVKSSAILFFLVFSTRESTISWREVPESLKFSC